MKSWPLPSTEQSVSTSSGVIWPAWSSTRVLLAEGGAGIKSGASRQRGHSQSRATVGREHIEFGIGNVQLVAGAGRQGHPERVPDQIVTEAGESSATAEVPVAVRAAGRDVVCEN